MEYVILDIEWNGTYSHKLKRYFNEIIELGAVKFDDNKNIIDEFSTVICPQVGKKISSRVQCLTNITDNELSTGLKFDVALEKFKEFLGDLTLMTWGTSDILVLMENNEYYYGERRLNFIKKFIDLQRYCEHKLEYINGPQLGLVTATQLLDIDTNQRGQHRALNDSILSFECLKRLFDKDELEDFVQDSDCDEFYDRIGFKTAIIRDLNNPLIDRSDMEFECDVCGTKAKKISTWSFRNKSYRAKFECPNCGHSFIGRIQFKLKYEGLIAKKSLISMDEENNDEK